MTLVQVLADELNIHMACDFRLTDARTGALVLDTAHKLVSAGPFGTVLVGVTGVAYLEGQPIAEWVVRTLGRPNGVPTLDKVVEHLREAAEGPLANIRDAATRRTTFVVAGHVGTQARICLVSNFEVFLNGQIQRSPLAASTVAASSVKPKSPLYLATGAAYAVPSSSRHEATTLLRSHAGPEVIREKLAEINAAASAVATEISEGCYAESRDASGRGSGQPFLTESHPGDFIPPAQADMLRQMGITLNRKVGPDGKPMPIRVVSSTSVFVGSGEKYFQGQLRLTPNDAEVWTGYGADLEARGKLTEATAAYVRASELDPNLAAPYANLARRSWLDSHDAAEADRLYRTALDLWAEGVPPWVLGDYGAFRFDAFEDAAGAEGYFRRAAAFEDYPFGKARLGDHILRTGGERNVAERLFEEALRDGPDNGDTLCIVGLAEVRHLGARESGRAKIERACTLDPTRELYLRSAAEVCLLCADGISAAYYFRKAARRGATGWDFECSWALALLLADKVEGARRHLARALAEDVPENYGPIVEMNMAAILYATGRKEDAVLRLQELLNGSVALNPAWELEILAMLDVANRGQDADRFKELMAQGATDDPLTLTAMVVRGTDSERRRATHLAELIKRTP